jgi:hypothetical protein
MARTSLSQIPLPVSESLTNNSSNGLVSLNFYPSKTLKITISNEWLDNVGRKQFYTDIFTDITSSFIDLTYHNSEFELLFVDRELDDVTELVELELFEDVDGLGLQKQWAR